jgi:phenylacetate-coenzyme A ligase PaaK-like adenylate-forming protein
VPGAAAKRVFLQREYAGATLDAIAHHQRARLRRLLAHAVAHSPLHAKRLAGIDPATFELADLPELPVMTKADMMDRLDDVFTILGWIGRPFGARSVRPRLSPTGTRRPESAGGSSRPE